MQFPGIPVIVLGMGRSGSSYLTSFLAANSVDLGGKLIPGGAGNPRGFFEDAQIVAFHQALLRRLRPGPNFDQADLDLVPFPELTRFEKDQAAEILQRLAKPGLWGWKDPRTIHFIGFWLEQLPHARIIIPLRHPLDVAYSYLKRILTIDRVIDIQRIFRAYAQHHKRILELVEERPDRCLAIYTPNAFASPVTFGAVLARFLDLGDGAPPPTPGFEPSEFTRLCIHRDAAEIFAILLPEAAAAFEKLNDRAHFRFDGAAPASSLHPVLLQLARTMKASGQQVSPENWLPLLLDLCQSEKGYFALQAEWLTSYSERTRFVELQVQNITEELRSHAALVKEQAEWIGELEEGKRFLLAQAECHKKELETQESLLKEQAEWIGQLEEGKRFLLAQAECHKKELETQQSLLREQAEWIGQLEEAKRFLRAKTVSCEKERESNRPLFKKLKDGTP